MIRFYLDGQLDGALVDFDMLADGTLLPNHQSQNSTFVTNIIVHVDDIGITPAQLDIIRAFAKTQEVVVSFLEN